MFQKRLQAAISDTVDGRNPANHLLHMKSYETWDILNINWCKISSINGSNWLMLTPFETKQQAKLMFEPCSLW